MDRAVFVQRDDCLRRVPVDVLAANRPAQSCALEHRRDWRLEGGEADIPAACVLFLNDLTERLYTHRVHEWHAAHTDDAVIPPRVLECFEHRHDTSEREGERQADCTDSETGEEIAAKGCAPVPRELVASDCDKR